MGGVDSLAGEDCARLMRGASVLGTGGGGSWTVAGRLLADLQARDLRLPLLRVQDLAETALGLSTVVLGGGLSHAELEALPLAEDPPASLRAARALEAHLGRRFDFVYPIELGPQNTLEAVRLAERLQRPLLDGDCAGRAVPEMLQTTLSALGLPLAPYAIATFQGDLLVVASNQHEQRNEVLCRALAQASGGVIVVAGFVLDGAQARRAIIPATLSRCIEIGGVVGSAGTDLPARIAATGDGRLAFRGVVEACPIRCEGGFFRGAVELAGRGAWQGQRYRIGVQNEFLWSWRDGAPDICCPDLICVVDSASGIGKVTYGHGFANSIEVGQDLSVLHLPAPAPWASGALPDPFPPAPAFASFDLPAGTNPC